MEWFGISLYGVPDPIKDILKIEYKEPRVQETITEILNKGTKKSFAELVSQIDVYIGRIDGYYYNSYDRLIRTRKKCLFKPIGPNEMYQYAGTDAMKIGFWKSDSLLENQSWYKMRTYDPKPSSDISKYFTDAKKVDKFFRL